MAVPIALNSTGTTSLLVNHRFSSVKNLWVALQGPVGGSTILNSITARTKATLKSYQWRIGGVNVPQKPIDVSFSSGAEGSAEVERCLRGMNNVLGSCSITRDQWSRTAAGDQQGAFAIATQLDVFDFTTDKPARSGVSTLDSPLYLDLAWSAQTGEALTAYVFCHYDSSIIVDGSTGQVMELHYNILYRYCINMSNAYCVKCKKKVAIKGETKTTVNGHPAAKGTCPNCGTKVFAFLPGKK